MSSQLKQTTSRLSPGRVARIRVNPKDCMAVVDIVQQAHLYQKNMSFAHAVSIAISCMAESFRQNNIIPAREGFEYSDMMELFPDNTQGRKKEQYGQTVKLNSQGDIVYPIRDLQPAPSEHNLPPELQLEDPEHHSNPRVRKLFFRLKELELKQTADPLNFDQVEFDALNKELCSLL